MKETLDEQVTLVLTIRPLTPFPKTIKPANLGPLEEDIDTTGCRCRYWRCVLWSSVGPRALGFTGSGIAASSIAAAMQSACLVGLFRQDHGLRPFKLQELLELHSDREQLSLYPVWCHVRWGYILLEWIGVRKKNESN